MPEIRHFRKLILLVQRAYFWHCFVSGCRRSASHKNSLATPLVRYEEKLKGG